MAYLHDWQPLPILHRDIKSENILVTKDLTPKIADLGEARVMAENRAMTIVGTNGYTAPEVLKGEPYGPSADVFSFAIVMSEVTTLQKTLVLFFFPPPPPPTAPFLPNALRQQIRGSAME